MPWKPSEAQSHNKDADTPKLRKIWASTANSVLEDTNDEGRAVRIANHAVAQHRRKTEKAFVRGLLGLLGQSNYTG